MDFRQIFYTGASWDNEELFRFWVKVHVMVVKASSICLLASEKVSGLI